MSKTLVIYYSHSGNTRHLAEMIAKQAKGDCLEIVPQDAYPQGYNEVVAQAQKEIKAGYRPALKNKAMDLSAYDTVLVGTPNWWSSIAPPIATFLENNDLSEKKVAVFCTHGGGGFGHIEKDVKALCPDSQMLSGWSVYGNGAGAGDAEKWLKKIKVL